MFGSKIADRGTRRGRRRRRRRNEEEGLSFRKVVGFLSKS